MDYSEISTLIGSIGVPAALCVLMFIQMTKQTDAINDLKVAIQHLTDMITRGGTDEYPYKTDNDDDR